MTKKVALREEFYADDEFLRKLVVDLRNGDIFSTFSCTGMDEILTSFPLLAMLNSSQKKFLKDRQVTFIYEYMHKASPIRANGKPIFMSFRYLSNKELTRMLDILKEHAEQFPHGDNK